MNIKASITKYSLQTRSNTFQLCFFKASLAILNWPGIQKKWGLGLCIPFLFITTLVSAQSGPRAAKPIVLGLDAKPAFAAAPEGYDQKRENIPHGKWTLKRLTKWVLFLNSDIGQS